MSGFPFWISTKTRGSAFVGLILVGTPLEVYSTNVPNPLASLTCISHMVRIRISPVLAAVSPSMSPCTSAETSAQAMYATRLNSPCLILIQDRTSVYAVHTHVGTRAMVRTSVRIQRFRFSIIGKNLMWIVVPGPCVSAYRRWKLPLHASEVLKQKRRSARALGTTFRRDPNSRALYLLINSANTLYIHRTVLCTRFVRRSSRWEEKFPQQKIGPHELSF